MSCVYWSITSLIRWIQKTSLSTLILCSLYATTIPNSWGRAVLFDCLHTKNQCVDAWWDEHSSDLIYRCPRFFGVLLQSWLGWYMPNIVDVMMRVGELWHTCWFEACVVYATILRGDFVCPWCIFTHIFEWHSRECEWLRILSLCQILALSESELLYWEWVVWWWIRRVCCSSSYEWKPWA